jgi:hypothetical protein
MPRGDETRTQKEEQEIMKIKEKQKNRRNGKRTLGKISAKPTPRPQRERV